MKAPLACCAVAFAAASGCGALGDGGRAEAMKACLDDFASQEFCTCAADEIDRGFGWLERRTFRAQGVSPNEAGMMNAVVRTCAAKVPLAQWPKSSRKGLRAACKGPEDSCQCMQASVARQFSFREVSAAVAAGKLQDDPQFKAAMKKAVQECPEAFFAENDPWPEQAVAKMAETCMKGDEANRAYCECLAQRVSKRVKVAVIIRVGAGDAEAGKQVKEAMQEISPECSRQEPEPAAPAPHTHRRRRGK